MNVVRSSTIGKTRSCPHCKATILDSANVCPACSHYLRFEPPSPNRKPVPTFTPLKIEGTIRHPSNGEPWEYSVVLKVQNERGEEVSRQVVGVGALNPAERRTFTLSVEVFAPKNSALMAADFK
jgi:hypothetical protein